MKKILLVKLDWVIISINQPFQSLMRRMLWSHTLTIKGVWSPLYFVVRGLPYAENGEVVIFSHT